ncbi:MAG TPA: BamA/TamA family outer membrane protein, partial [Thermoanaerobaculia bacterium]|nr:BamA/TamA family outer membrane protein [Thermoanaerobaculia bacterium]
LEAAMEEVLGLSSDNFSTAWQTSILETYQPVLAERQAPEAIGTRILPREEESEDVYIAPALNPEGDQVVFISSRSLFSYDLYLADARTGEIKSLLVSSTSDPHFDSLRFLDSAGAWSPDSRKFAFVVFARGDNELAIVDIASRDIERRIPIENVGAIWNPAWSPDGRYIAFSGAAGGLTDLFLHDLQSGTTRRLTNDSFSDLQPSWSPDGHTLAFVSDRAAGESLARLTRGSMGVWLMDVEGGTGAGRNLRQVADTLEGDHYNPRFGPGGSDLFFLSDRDGVSDLYRVALADSAGSEAGQAFRVTRVTTGVTGITRLSPALTVAERTGRVMVSVFRDTSYQIHVLEPAQTRGEPVAQTPAPPANRAAADLLPPADPRGTGAVAEYLRQPGGLEGARGRSDEIRGTAGYRPRLQLDFIGPSIGIGASTLGYSFAGDITAFFSDVLGQREVGLSVHGGTGTVDELGAQGYYLDQSNRWQWGAAGGHVPYISAFATARSGPVEVDGEIVQGTVFDQVIETVTVDEASFISRYPFSTTQRFEFDAGYTRLGFENELRRVVLVGNQVVEDSERSLPAGETLQLFQSSAALVGDSSFFGFTSPVRGRRYRLEVEGTFGDLQFQSLIADYRRYFFARPVTLALRGLHFGRYGTDAESPRLSPLYVGRPTLVRGYEADDIEAAECTVVPGSPDLCPEFDRLAGSKMAVANLEVRVPLFGVRGFGLIELPFLPTELSAFVDAGVAWTDDESPELRFERESTARVPSVSAGLSARVLLGGFAVLELYYAKPFQRPGEDWVTGFLIAPGW